MALLFAGCANSESQPLRVPSAASATLGEAGDGESNGPSTKPALARITPPTGELLGRSLRGCPIVKREYFGSPTAKDTVLLFAGIHGDESTTVFAAAKLIELLDRDPAVIPPMVHLVIIPVANPDGYEAHTRQNSRLVDLNRNFPAKNFQPTPRHNEYWPGPSPLSEPESRTLHDLVESLKPNRILALHSIKPGKHGVNYDGPAKALATLIASKNGYNVLETMGYPTPGSFGSWAGIDHGIPTITLEFPSRTPGPQAWADNRDALLAFIRGK